MDATPRLRVVEAIRLQPDHYRNVMKSLIKDAMRPLKGMEEHCNECPALKPEFLLLKHYLEYMERFTEGKA